MSNPDSSGGEWRRLAKKVAGKINAAWWLEKLAVPLVVASLIASCLILLARRELTEFPWMETAITGGLLLAGMALLAWVLARRNFESQDQAMVRIEASMKMRNALSAAKEGVAPWPEVPAKPDDGTRWRWSRLFLPVIAATLFITASVLLPVSAKTDPNSGPPDEPQSWKDLEAEIAALGEDDAVQEEYLEELEKRLKELRNQNEDEWFSHSSIEATDALKKMHGAEVENLERNLRKAERALNALQKHGGQMGEGARQRLLEEFDEALKEMGEGKMKPNKELLEQLKGIDPKNLGQIPQEQLDQLRENMKKHAQNCQNCQGGGQGEGQAGAGGGQGEDWLDELLEQAENEDGQGNQNGQPGANPGQGGLDRGPGTAPGVLGKLGGDVKTGDLEGLESEDLSRSLPGDLLELADGEHEVDKTKVGIRAGGEIEGKGEGGDRVWKDALLPSEKKALREFFK